VSTCYLPHRGFDTHTLSFICFDFAWCCLLVFRFLRTVGTVVEDGPSSPPPPCHKLLLQSYHARTVMPHVARFKASTYYCTQPQYSQHAFRGGWMQILCFFFVSSFRCFVFVLCWFPLLTLRTSDEDGPSAPPPPWPCLLCKTGDPRTGC
jgi:hypothetical protein